MFATLVLSQKLGDRFGRKRIFLLGLAIFTLASAACALAQSDTQLIGARAIQGIGGALLNPLSLSIIVAAFRRKQLPQAMATWQASPAWAWPSARCSAGSWSSTSRGRRCS